MAEAAEKTARIEGVRYTVSGNVAIPDIGRVPFTGSGVTDTSGKRGSARIDMSAMADLGRGGGRDRSQVDSSKLTMTMVYDSRTFYMKFPLLYGAVGRPWMQFDFVETATALGIDPALVRATQQQGDPTATLRFLRTVSDGIEKVGEQDVRGVRCTHYRATVDLRKYPELVPEPQRRRARRSVRRLVELNGGRATTNTEVWVGDDKLVRRMKWEQYQQLPEERRASRSTYTSEFFDFGTRVPIKTPRSRETTDMTDEIAADLRRQYGRR